MAAVSGPLALTTRHVGADAVASPAATSPAAVGAFAELFVAAYLEAGEADAGQLAAFTGDVPDLRGQTAAGAQVLNTAVVSIAAQGARYWSVTVAAAVRSTSLPAPGVRYLAVGILETTEGLVAADLPAEVPGPGRARRPSLSGPTPTAPSDGDPIGQTVAQFLDAYLAGNGSLGRYVTPGADIAPVDPAPYAEVTLDRLAVVRRSERVVEVRSFVRAVEPNGAVRWLRYRIDLESRAGRWEVAGVSGAPHLAAAPAAPRTEPPTASSAPVPFDPLPPDPNEGEPQP